LKISSFPNATSIIYVETDAIVQNYPDVSLELKNTLIFADCERGEVLKSFNYSEKIF
jgi:hypothetical protein